MALREINLIPADILFGRKLLRHLYLWAALLIISLASIFGFHLYQTNIALAQKLPFSTLEDVRAHLDSRIEEIKRIQEELIMLNQQQSVLEKVTENPAYSLLLLKLANMMDGNTWLTQLTVDSDNEAEYSANLMLTGFSVRSEELGNFIEKLSNEPIFQAVLLRYAKEAILTIMNQNMGEPSSLIQFQIECKILRS